jgi:hypothetical protein
MVESRYLMNGSNVCVNIDFTSKTDGFLILSALIQFLGALNSNLFFDEKLSKEERKTQSIFDASSVYRTCTSSPHKFIYKISLKRGVLSSAAPLSESFANGEIQCYLFDLMSLGKE